MITRCACVPLGSQAGLGTGQNLRPLGLHHHLANAHAKHWSACHDACADDQIGAVTARAAAHKNAHATNACARVAPPSR